MGKVTKIEHQKKRQDRFSVYVDDKFEVGLSESEIIELDIFQGKVLTQKELKNIKNHSSFTKIKDKAIRLLSIRPRSIFELEEKLELKKYDKGIIRKVIDDLISDKLLDDKKFAQDWINHRMNFSSMGRRRISLELWKKKIKKEVIDKEISKISSKEELEKALEIGQKKYSFYREEDSRKKKEKLIGFLMRKGFSWDIISKVLDRLKT